MKQKRKISIFLGALLFVFLMANSLPVYAQNDVDLKSDLEYYYNFEGENSLESKGLAEGDLEEMDTISVKGGDGVSDAFGKYLYFESEGIDYLFAPEGFLDGFDDQITVSMWIKPSAFTVWARLFDFGQGDSYFTMHLWPVGDGGRVSVMYTVAGFDGKVAAYTETQTLMPDTWHHVATTIENKIMSLYVDGVFIASVEIPESLKVFEGSLDNMFGKSRYAHDPLYEGLMDEIRIYKRALNAAEIAALAGGALDAPVIESDPNPTVEPTTEPTVEPTVVPTVEPTVEPTQAPNEVPTQSVETTPDTVEDDNTSTNNGWMIWVVIGVAAVIAIIVVVIVISKKKKG